MPRGDAPLPPMTQRLCYATKQLVQAVGGVEAVAEHIGKSKSQVSRTYQPHEPDMMTIADVAACEAVTHGLPGWPHVTTALAAMTGHRLVPIEPDAAPMDDWLTKSAAMLMRVADLGNEIGADLANDGVIDPTEARAIIGKIHVAMASMRALEAMANAVLDAVR